MRFIDRLNSPDIALPKTHVPVQADSGNRYMIISHFFRCLRDAQHVRADVSILQSIQRTADITDNNDAYVAKVLVEAGLRAPRMAFPGEYLDHVTTALSRTSTQMGAANDADKDLHAHWMAIGDDPFAGFEWVNDLELERSTLMH